LELPLLLPTAVLGRVGSCSRVTRAPVQGWRIPASSAAAQLSSTMVPSRHRAVIFWQFQSRVVSACAIARDENLRRLDIAMDYRVTLSSQEPHRIKGIIQPGNGNAGRAEDFDIDADSVEPGTVMVQLQPWKPQQGDSDDPAMTLRVARFRLERSHRRNPFAGE